MFVNSLNYASNAVQFGNARSQEQFLKKKQLQKEIRQREGKDDGLRVVKFYVPSFPADSREVDTGIGYVNSLQAQKLFRLASDLFDANAVKIMPNTELTDLPDNIRFNKRPPAYNRSSLTLGDDVINIPALTTKKYGKILSKEDARKLVDLHLENGRDDIIDFDTNLAYENQENHPVNEYLGYAYNNFLHAPDPSKELIALRKEFEEFKKDPLYDEICSRTALFPMLKDWGTGKIPNNFFIGFDTHPTEEQREQFARAKKKYQGAIDFYKFKKFLALKNEQEGVELIHRAGLKAFKDVNLNWSYPETQVFPDAFKSLSATSVAEGGWGVSTLKYEDLLEKNNSAAHKLLAMKLETALRIYDGLRLDVGWHFIQPKYSNTDFCWQDYSSGRPKPCNVIPKFIEKVAKEIKGEDYDVSNILYECDTSIEDFNLRDRNNAELINSLPGRIILSTEFEHQEGEGWANVKYVLDKLGINPDKVVFQTNNHDTLGVPNCVDDYGLVERQVGGMMNSLNADWTELKDNCDPGANVYKYTRGRHAEVELGKNVAILENTLRGTKSKIDYHNTDHERDYKIRMGVDWEKELQENISKGSAYTTDAKIFRAKCDGSYYKNRDLYEQLEKYAAWEKRCDEGAITMDEIEESPLGQVDITKVDLEILKHGTTEEILQAAGLS